jgi:hypothetical protein
VHGEHVQAFDLYKSSSIVRQHFQATTDDVGNDEPWMRLHSSRGSC